MSQHNSTDPDATVSMPTVPVSDHAADTYPGSSDESATARILESQHDSIADTAGPADADTDAGSSSTADAAKQQGQQVRDEAVEGGQHVASVATDQAKSVASEATGQAKDLMAEARSQLGEQAATQQGNLATWLHSLADELHAMTDKDGSTDADPDGDRPAAATAGMVSDFASRTQGQVKGAADWLEQHDPADLLEEATRFARRRPGAFLAVAAVAGLVAGRLTRGLKADSGDDHDVAGADVAGADVDGVDDWSTEPASAHAGVALSDGHRR